MMVMLLTLVSGMLITMVVMVMVMLMMETTLVATRSGNMMGVSSLYRAAAVGSSPVNLVMVSIIHMMLMLMMMVMMMVIMLMTTLMITKPGDDDDHFLQPEDMRQHEAVGEAVGHVEVGAWIQAWGQNQPFLSG